jgi:acetyl-CoA acetyltransferase
MLRPVHVAGFAQLPAVTSESGLDEAEMVRDVTAAALLDAGLTRPDVGFVCSGSNDYVMGRPFSFVMAVDGVGAWPPIRESHVEMDGAWALYEAFIRLQHGDVDVALVYGFGKSSLGSVDQVRTLELDPYTLSPLGIDPHALAALQARVLIDSGRATERDFAAVVARSRAAAASNPNVPSPGITNIDALLAAPYRRDPLRAHDCAVQTDGAAAMVLTVGGKGPRITGLEHRIDAHQPGARDLGISRSARLAGEAAGATNIDVAELHAPWSHQEILLVDALGLDGEAINPSGGALAAETQMVTGLTRIGEAALAVRNGARRALGHATSGPLLQHNLVCVLEAS